MCTLTPTRPLTPPPVSSPTDSCKKKVDSTSATDHEGELYCSSCHVKLFGPKGSTPPCACVCVCVCVGYRDESEV